MAYADYDYYSGTYMGTVSEKDFPRLAIRASSFLDYYTMGKANDNADLDALKMACCALVDQYAMIDAAQAAAARNIAAAAAGAALVKSETVGDYSRTIATGEEVAVSALATATTIKKVLAEIVAEYLAHTGCCIAGGGAVDVCPPHRNRL